MGRVKTTLFLLKYRKWITIIVVAVVAYLLYRQFG